MRRPRHPTRPPSRTVPIRSRRDRRSTSSCNSNSSTSSRGVVRPRLAEIDHPGQGMRVAECRLHGASCAAARSHHPASTAATPLARVGLIHYPGQSVFRAEHHALLVPGTPLEDRVMHPRNLHRFLQFGTSTMPSRECRAQNSPLLLPGDAKDAHFPRSASRHRLLSLATSTMPSLAREKGQNFALSSSTPNEGCQRQSSCLAKILGAHHAGFGVLNIELGSFTRFLAECWPFRATWVFAQHADGVIHHPPLAYGMQNSGLLPATNSTLYKTAVFHNLAWWVALPCPSDHLSL